MRTDNQTFKIVDAFVGQRLRMRRVQLGHTLVEVAGQLGISHQQVQKYELGQTRLSAPTLYQLSTIYEVKPQYFFDGLGAYMRNQADDFQSNYHTNLSIMALCDDPSEEMRLRQVVDNYPKVICLFFVHNSDQAMNILRKRVLDVSFTRPDLIFVDLDVAKRNGLSLLADIKRDRDIMDIPVVIFASIVNQHTLSLVYGYQAAGYISKHSENYARRVHQVIEYWESSVVLPFLQNEDDIREGAPSHPLMQETP